jgi:hypothetical protein
MKRFTMNMTLAVAALAVAAGTVSAQTMRAEIPFAFRVGDKIMQAGEYRLNMTSSGAGTPLLTVANLNDKQTVLVVPIYRNAVAKKWLDAGLPKMSFACGEGVCTISSMWMGEGDTFNFHSSRGKYGEPRIAEIVLRPEKAAD